MQPVVFALSIYISGLRRGENVAVTARGLATDARSCLSLRRARRLVFGDETEGPARWREGGV